MVTQTSAEELKKVEGFTISALTHRQIVEWVEEKSSSAELLDERRTAEVIDPERPAIAALDANRDGIIDAAE
jgi:hypothetical protein